MSTAAAAQADGYVPVICGMGRTLPRDLERTWEAVRHAQRPRVHMVLATSEIHMKHKLHMTRDQVRNPACYMLLHVEGWKGLLLGDLVPESGLLQFVWCLSSKRGLLGHATDMLSLLLHFSMLF